MKIIKLLALVGISFLLIGCSCNKKNEEVKSLDTEKIIERFNNDYAFSENSVFSNAEEMCFEIDFDGEVKKEDEYACMKSIKMSVKSDIERYNKLSESLKKQGFMFTNYVKNSNLLLESSHFYTIDLLVMNNNQILYYNDGELINLTEKGYKLIDIKVEDGNDYYFYFVVNDYEFKKIELFNSPSLMFLDYIKEHFDIKTK